MAGVWHGMTGKRHAMCESALSFKDPHSSGNKDSFVIKQMNSIKSELIRQLP